MSGHRIGTEEVESALISCPGIAEAAVVGIPHPIKGEAIYAFLTLAHEVKPSSELKQEAIRSVREKIGALATPEVIQWASALPKTRSGKILRRILRKIANQDTDDLGDISTLNDSSIIQSLIQDSQAIFKDKS